MRSLRSLADAAPLAQLQSKCGAALRPQPHLRDSGNSAKARAWRGGALVASALVAALCGACNPETYAGARAISLPHQYDHLSCDALAANIKAGETRIAELKTLTAKAERGPAGSAIGDSVYWPQMAQDQANLRIMRETLAGRQDCAARR